MSRSRSSDQGRDPRSSRTGTNEARWSWRDDAACAGQELNVFFPVGTNADAVRRLKQAKQICAGCAVRDACLQWALKVGVDYGVFGGLDPLERRSVRGLPGDAADAFRLHLGCRPDHSAGRP